MFTAKMKLCIGPFFIIHAVSASCDPPVPSEEQIRENVQHLKEWISKEPHLPTIQDEDFLKTFLYKSKFNLERTEQKLDAYYSVRSLYPEILKNRDPTSPQMLRSRKARPIGVSNRRLKDGSLLILIKLSPNPKLYNTVNEAKRHFMVFDALLLEQHRSTGYVFVTDCQNLSHHHFLRAFACVKAMQAISNAYPDRVKAVHFINAPQMIHRFVALLKAGVSTKMGRRMHTHTRGKDDLRNIIDKDVLCQEFGGDGPNFSEYDDHCQQLLEKYKEWFKEQDNVCSNEILRGSHDMRLAEIRSSSSNSDVDS